MAGDYGTKDALSGSLISHFFSQEDVAMQPDWLKHYFTPNHDHPHGQPLQEDDDAPGRRGTATGGGVPA